MEKSGVNKRARVKNSHYMNWAKTSSAAQFNLANSGLANMKLSQLHVQFKELEITTEFPYGYPPLVNALAERLGVPAESVVTAAGTSSANHLAMATLIDPGDEVLIECPTYEPLLALAGYFGAEVRRFTRRFEEGFRITVEEIEKALTPRTRLIVLTNLNNPTGVMTDNETLRRIGELARSVNARVLIDEVYLETFFQQRPQTAFLLGPEFVVTSSLTKAFGLSGLRCGWIISEPDLAMRMWLLNDLIAPSPVHVGERLSVMALEQIDDIANRAEKLLETNRALVNEFLTSRRDLETIQPAGGTVFFPRLTGRDCADQFCSLLMEKYATSVVPGRYFEMPAHFRLGIGGDSDTLQEALVRIGRALDELKGIQEPK
jgi:aspartate/methionine/tyrosine aminotransferase